MVKSLFYPLSYLNCCFCGNFTFNVQIGQVSMILQAKQTLKAIGFFPANYI